MIEITKENFEQEVTQSTGPVVLDFWGPQCGPCLALMPEIEKLAAEYEGKVTFCKVNVAGNRRMCIELKVMSVPTFLFFNGGECKDRLAGAEVTLEAVKVKTAALTS